MNAAPAKVASKIAAVARSAIRKYQRKIYQ
jgi:hypothetical protein